MRPHTHFPNRENAPRSHGPNAANPDRAIPADTPMPDGDPNIPPETRDIEPITPRNGGGLAIVAKLNGHEFTVPDPSWDIDTLGQYARQQEQILRQRHQRMAIDIYLLGQALHTAKEKIRRGDGYGNWGKFLDEYDISPSSDARARKLFKFVDTPNDLDGMSITAAYVNYGVAKPRQKADPDSASTTESQEPKNPKDSTPGAPESSKPRADDKAADTEAADAPPEKENTNSPLSVLIKVQQRLEYLIEDARQCDWDKEPVGDCHRVVRGIGNLLGQITREMPQPKGE
ncbi:MAG: hypothetical protein HQ567_14345 [Candidatus Nealsonbacteria bacterium]|nr:hypothetical protein [Candidatus Nealsonbacteria bacterium]